jgi:tRNA(Arg) A34 adenosine deaminase TadA
MHNAFMRRAIELARAGIEEPGALPVAALVVKDGEVLGEGINRSYGNLDPTSHAEIEAIRAACRRLGAVTLEGCELYTTAEPCSMCVATIHLVGVARLFYGAASADTAAFFVELAKLDPGRTRLIAAPDLRREVGLPIEQRAMPARQFMAPEAKEVLDDFLRRQVPAGD